jgi:hypothetical protein
MTFSGEQGVFRCVALFAFPCLLATASAGQVSRSPTDIVRFITYQDGRPGAERLAFAGCGISADGLADRAAAASLVGLGGAAVPAIESALDSLDRSGYVANAHLLLYAYAKILGQAAYPRLWRMDSSPELDDLRLAVDDSIALSFGLTSYVSGYRTPMRTFRCRGQQPRDALDQLIVGWERDDRRWVESTLGPAARASLDSLLKSRTWAEMRAELWPRKPTRGLAVGYRFEIPSRWSEPELDVDGARYPDESSGRVALDARFTGRSGADCEAYRVAFVRTPSAGPPAYLRYLVDNSDLRGLLRLIGSCAAGE